MDKVNKGSPRQYRYSRTVPQGAKGLTAPPIKNKIALRVSLTGSVFMDNVRVGQDSLLPGTKGLGSAFACLNSAR
jgi:glutaryl-CoA dehydrogenase